MYRVIKVLGVLPELRTIVNLTLPEQVFLHECKGYKRLNNLSARIPTEFQMIVGMSALISLEIKRAVQEVGGTADTKEDLAFVNLQSKQCINSWKSHLLRSKNQDESRLDVIDELDETSALGLRPGNEISTKEI